MIATHSPQRGWIQALEDASDRSGWVFPRPETAEMNVVSWRNPTSRRMVTLRRALRPRGAAGHGSVTWGFWDERNGVRPVLIVRECRPPDDRMADEYLSMYSAWLREGMPEAEFREKHRTVGVESGLSVGDGGWIVFGDRSEVAFEIAADAWRMWVGNQLLTRHRDGDGRLSEWLPLEDLARLCGWISSHWRVLAFGTDMRPALIRDGSVSACHAVSDARPWTQASTESRDAVEQWSRRHAIRTASGRLPNLLVERLADDLVFSWNSEPTAGLSWEIRHGTHCLTARFAVPMLRDVCNHMTRTGLEPGTIPEESVDHVGWVQAVETLKEYHPSDRLNEGWLGNAGFGHRQLSEFALTGTSRHPVVGLLRSSRTTRVTLDDIGRILGLLQPAEGDTWLPLRKLAQGLDASIDPREPWTSGYDLASAIRARVKFEGSELLDLDRLSGDLGIRLADMNFDDPDIRGACVGAPAYRPMIVVNPTSADAAGVSGRRTTIAHELCHLLFDRSLMRGLARFEGPVADGDRHVEMRANAFAIEFLAPRSRLILPDGSVLPDEKIPELSATLQVSVAALLWHANNLRRAKQP